MFDNDDFSDYSMAGYSFEEDFSDEMADDDLVDDFEDDESEEFEDFEDNIFGEAPDSTDDPYDDQEWESGYDNEIGFDDEEFYKEGLKEEMEEDWEETSE